MSGRIRYIISLIDQKKRKKNFINFFFLRIFTVTHRKRSGTSQRRIELKEYCQERGKPRKENVLKNEKEIHTAYLI